MNDKVGDKEKKEFFEGSSQATEENFAITDQSKCVFGEKKLPEANSEELFDTFSLFSNGVRNGVPVNNINIFSTSCQKVSQGYTRA